MENMRIEVIHHIGSREYRLPKMLLPKGIRAYIDSLQPGVTELYGRQITVGDSKPIESIRLDPAIEAAARQILQLDEFQIEPVFVEDRSLFVKPYWSLEGKAFHEVVSALRSQLGEKVPVVASREQIKKWFAEPDSHPPVRLVVVDGETEYAWTDDELLAIRKRHPTATIEVYDFGKTLDEQWCRDAA